MESIHKAIPKGKGDFDSLKALRELDIERVKLILPELMKWLQDINWPVARALSKDLAEYGSILLPHIRYVLSSGDP